jgi:xanthine dehydrogenase molybdenum-binding subunit
MELIVNGKPMAIAEKPGEMLSDLLREQLGLTGTKIGCNEAECGACTVLVDGKPQLSCIYPAARADGKQILTIEGLASRTSDDWKLNLAVDSEQRFKLHPLQRAFIDYGAVQCGFCIPGQLMTAYALLQTIPDPEEGQIRHALKDTLCRCAGYPTIINAIKAAALTMRTGDHLPSVDISESEEPLEVIGSLQPRPDAVGKVTGEAKFTDDLQFEGMLYARVKRSGVPHAFVEHIDTTRAKALTGVLVVLTAEDIPGEKYHGLVIPDWPILVGVGERVRYVGDAVAIVAAESKEIASQAIDMIEVVYDPLNIISDPVQARKVDTPSLHPDGNLLKHIKVRKGDIERTRAGDRSINGWRLWWKGGYRWTDSCSFVGASVRSTSETAVRPARKPAGASKTACYSDQS